MISNGTVYTNAYTASPICLPSRCCWATGMSPHNNGSISNIFGAVLSKEYPNLFTTLHREGFETSMHGKCHFIPVPYPATRKDVTLDYEHFISYYKSLGMQHLDLEDGKNNSTWFFDDYSKELQRKGMLRNYRTEMHLRPEHQGVFPFPLPTECYPDIWTAEKTVDRIDGCDPKDKEFIWCSFAGPHYPVDTPSCYTERERMEQDSGRVFSPDEWNDDTKYHYSGYWGPGTTEGSGHVKDGAQKNYSESYWRNWRRCYLGNILLIDEQIGKILDAAERKWGDDFTVIFSSDHGEMMGNHSLWGKNGSLFDDVLHVPLIVYSPKSTHKECGQWVSSLDVFPTIMKLAGVEAEAEGVPLDELCEKGGRDYVISECENRVAVKMGRYKLEWNKNSKTGVMFHEFYDLEKDPFEFLNVYEKNEYHDTIRKMESILEEKEKHERLLSSLFYTPDGDEPYWLDDGNGAGLHKR